MKLKNLPGGTYEKISAQYISLIDGNGCTCDNCGRLIANIVTVKHESGRQYTIGQDCAKTLFDEKTNKSIDQEIKVAKRHQAYEAKAAEQNKRRAALREVMDAAHAAGINNTNLNEQWAREKYNEIVESLENKHGFYITYRR